MYFFIADQKYVTVVHAEGETLIDDTLKELEEEFADRFVRVHRNALVAVEQIQGLQRVGEGHVELQMKNCENGPQVSRRHVSKVKALLKSL